MNETHRQDMEKLADIIMYNNERMDIYLMALAKTVENIKEVDEEEDLDLKPFTNTLGTLHDLILEELNEMTIVEDSIRDSIENKKENI